MLDPLERMIEKIKLIAKNPLAAAGEDINEAGVMSFISNNDKETGKVSKNEMKE